MHDVFISYSNHDKPIADAVCAGLEQRGIRCWIAPRDILAGREWGHAIVEAISSARVMVLLLSANANKSPQIPKEVDRAVNKGVTVIPLRIEDVQPAGALEYYLGPAHWLDALTPPLQSHIDRLAANISALLAGSTTKPADSTTATTRTPIPTPKPVAPPPLSGAPRATATSPPSRPVSAPAPPPPPPRAAFAAGPPPPAVAAEAPTPDATRIILYILAALVPVAGLIMWLVYKDKPDPRERQMATILLVIGLVSLGASVLFGCLCIAAAGAGGSGEGWTY
jgi:hypothetical protein